MTQIMLRSSGVLKARTEFLARVMMLGKRLSYPKVAV